MIKIDFNKQFAVLPGDDADHSKDDPINKILAFILSRVEETRDPVKLWHWAVKLANDGILELDKSDTEFLKSEVTKNKHLIVAGKAQILEIINKAVTEQEA